MTDDMKNATKSTTSSRNKGGRPKKPLNYELLAELVTIHCTGEECASVMKMDYDTLNNRLWEDGHGGFSDYFKKHSGTGKASLRRMQWSLARGGHCGMMIWLGKQYLDQKERGDVTSDNKPLQASGVHSHALDLSKLSKDEFDAFGKLMEKAREQESAGKPDKTVH